MEYLLDVKQPKPTQQSLSEDTYLVDQQHELEGNDPARYRYQRLFWEPVVEGAVCSSIIPR